MALVEMHAAGPQTPTPHLTSRRAQNAGQALVSPCRIVHAHSDDGLLNWSYTAGLFEAFHHPEFLLTGLDPFLAETVLCQLAEQVAGGHVFSESLLEKDLLHRLTCAFREIPGAMATVLMPLAHATVNAQPMRALQCIYPDNHNRLPWHFGYNASWHEVQPLFTAEMALTRVEMNLLRAAAGIDCAPTRHRVKESF